MIYYMLDLVLTVYYSRIQQCKYSDDTLLHQRTEKKVNQILKIIAARFQECAYKYVLREAKLYIVTTRSERRIIQVLSLIFQGIVLKRAVSEITIKEEIF